MSPERRLVCSFLLPQSLSPSDIVDWLAQMITMHSGIKATVETECGLRSIRVFVRKADDVQVVLCAIETNREDWRNAGVSEIRPAA